MRYKGICFAIEDDNEEVVVVPAEEVVIPAEVTEGAAEVEELGADAAEMQAAGDEAGEDLETLEEVRDVLADSVEAGEGVDQPAAAIAEIAVESICKRLGMKKVNFIPAMESFGSKNNRVAATRIAVEGIWETVKQGWAKLVEWLKKTWESIKGYFVKLFDQNLRLQKAAEEMKGKVAALSAEAKAEGDKATIENKSLANVFAAKGAETTLKGLVEITGKATTAFNGAVDLVKTLEGASVDAKFETKIEDVSKTSFNVVNALCTAMQSAPGAEKAGSAEKGFTVTIAGYKMGLQAEGAASKEQGLAAFALVWEKVEAPATKVPTLNKGDMEKVVAEVLALCKETADYKEIYGKMEKINKISLDTVEKILKGLEALSKAANKEGENAKGYAEARKQLSKTNSIMSSVGSKLPGVNVSTGKSALEYVSLSLKAHKAD